MSIKTLGISFSIGAALQNTVGDSFKTLDERSKNLTKNLKSIAFSKDLSAKVVKLNKEFKYLSEAKKRAIKQSGRFSSHSIDLKNKLAQTAKALVEAKTQAKAYGIELKTASKMQKALSKFENLNIFKGKTLGAKIANKNFRDQAKAQMIEKATLAASIIVPFKVGIEFESSMARVKALSGATNEEFKRLNQTAKDLGASTTFSASEVGQGMQYLSMAGFKANETIKAMPGVLNLASAAQSDLAITSDIASDILSSFGLKAEDMDKVGDILTKTFTTANTDLTMLGETMKYVGPVASKAGMSLQEASAMAGLLGNVGIKASQAGTTLRSMLLRLSAPTSETTKALKELKISNLDENGNVKNIVQLLAEVAEATLYK